MKHRLQNLAACAKRRGRTLASLCAAALRHPVIVHLSRRMVSFRTTKRLGREIRLYPTQSDSRTPTSMHFAIPLHSLFASIRTTVSESFRTSRKFFDRGLRRWRGSPAIFYPWNPRNPRLHHLVAALLRWVPFWFSSPKT